MKEKLVTAEIAGILDRTVHDYIYHGGVSYVNEYRSKAVMLIAQLMLDDKRLAALRAAIVAPAELVDIVDVTTMGFR